MWDTIQPVQALNDIRNEHCCCITASLVICSKESGKHPQGPSVFPCLSSVSPSVSSSTHMLLGLNCSSGHIGSAPEVTPKVRRSSKWRRRERELCFWDGKLKSWFLWFAVMSRLNKNQLNLKAFKICYLVKFFILKKVLYHPVFDYPDRKKNTSFYQKKNNHSDN